MKIPIAKPYFGEEESAYIVKPLETGWVVQGPYVQQFEEDFATFTGADYAVATSSCTTALHIAVASHNLKPGDEVIVPAFTWVATPNAVEYTGASVVFCDIDLQTFNIDVKQLEALITERTVGIIPVHLFGLAADIRPIIEIAERYGLWVVEDAACALGTYYQGEHVGLAGAAGCFSFHPRKSITTGEGGMIITNDHAIAEQARSLRDHGVTRSKTADEPGQTAQPGFLLADFCSLGYNYRMTDMQGALGVAQMQRAEWILRQRIRVAQLYDEALAEIPWLQLPTAADATTVANVHSYQAYVCLFGGHKARMGDVEATHQARNSFMAALANRGITTRQGTHAPIALSYYAQKYALSCENYPNAYLADRLSVALPLYPQMTTNEQQYVVDAILAYHAELS